MEENKGGGVLGTSYKQGFRRDLTRGTRRGAASFYIVAVSTLILVIMATSFATVIISEISRTANDDLSQSAYDSAMAGLEDAKVAYASYQRCLETGASKSTIKPTGSGDITCSEIRYWMEDEKDSCYTVGHILGKIPKDAESEVMVGSVETTGGAAVSTNQAYTCVKIETELDDYRVTLNDRNRRQTMRAQVGTGSTNSVKKIRLSWTAVKSSASETLGLVYPNLSSVGNNLEFAPWNYANMANPPVVELQIVQTGQTFSLSQFDETVENGANSQTNRATMFLVPTKKIYTTNEAGINTWSGSAKGGKNTISAEQVAQTNDRTVYHKPFAVFCDESALSAFYCSVEVTLPAPIGGGARNNGTFLIAVSLPYQQPDTDFAIELICDAGATCADGVVADASTGAVRLTNTQIMIDSTGRANDLYRRVQARLETSDKVFDSSYPIYALQVLGTDPVRKNIDAKYEPNDGNGFYF